MFLIFRSYSWTPHLSTSTEPAHVTHQQMYIQS